MPTEESRWGKNGNNYPSSRGRSVSEHVSESGDDVDGEADQKCPHSRVDRPKEGENNGQEPYWYHHRQPYECP